MSSQTQLTSRENLIDTAAMEIQAATRDVVDGKYNTSHIRAAAGYMIDLRMTFIDKHGNPDLMGNTYPYRKAVAEIMSRAGVSASERARVMNAVRYHLANLIRERFSTEELRELGFNELSPLERQKIDREQRSRVLRTASTPEEIITDPSDVVAALRSAANLLDHINATSLSAVDKKMAQVMVDHLRDRVTALGLDVAL